VGCAHFHVETSHCRLEMTPSNYVKNQSSAAKPDFSMWN